MKFTIMDIAKASGFSKSTVSRVLMNNPNVKTETRARVKEIMEKMNYHHNGLARSMVKGRINIILVVVGDILSSFYGLSIQAIEKKLYKAGYMTIMCNSEYNTEKEYKYLEFARDNKLSGVILMTAIDTPELNKLLLQFDCPVILMNRYLDSMELDAVVMDNYLGGYMATRHLIEMGHKRIFHISCPSNSTAGRDRRLGYLAAMEEAKLPVDPEMIIFSDLTIESGDRIARQFAKNLGGATAVFIANDQIAIGFLRGWTNCGMSVPKDLSIVSYDHSELLHNYAVPITTVGKNPKEMGDAASDLLLKRIACADKSIERITYAPDLLEMKSVKQI